MKSKPDRAVDNDVLTLLSYAQGDFDLLEKAIREHGSEQTDNDFCYLDSLSNYRAYLLENPDCDFAPIKNHCVLPATHHRLYGLNSDLRLEVLKAFTPEESEEHHNNSDTVINSLIDSAISKTKIPTRLSTFVKDKLHNITEALDTTFITHHRLAVLRRGA